MVNRYVNKVYASGLVGLPVIANGNQYGVCRDIAINVTNKEITYVILTCNNEMIELPFSKVVVGSGMLIVK